MLSASAPDTKQSASFPDTRKARQPPLVASREADGEPVSPLLQAVVVLTVVLGGWLYRKLRKPKAA